MRALQVAPRSGELKPAPCPPRCTTVGMAFLGAFCFRRLLESWCQVLHKKATWSADAVGPWPPGSAGHPSWRLPSLSAGFLAGWAGLTVPPLDELLGRLFLVVLLGVELSSRHLRMPTSDSRALESPPCDVADPLISSEVSRCSRTLHRGRAGVRDSCPASPLPASVPGTFLPARHFSWGLGAWSGVSAESGGARFVPAQPESIPSSSG